MPPSPLDGTHHALSNHRVELDGERAEASVYLIAGHWLKTADGSPHCVVRGHYHDQLVRTDAGWRISERVLTVAWCEGNMSVLAGRQD